MVILFAILLVVFSLQKFVTPQGGICQTNAGICVKLNATNYLNCYINNNNNKKSVSELLKNCSNNYTLVDTVNVFKNYPSTGGDLTIEIQLGERIRHLFVENNADYDYIHLRAFTPNNYLTYMRFSYFQGRFLLDSSNFFKKFPELRLISSSYTGSYVFAEETPTFTNLEYLSYLELQLLIINEPIITVNMVSGLRNLVKLDLTNSNFRKIEPNALQNLTNLQELHLHNNNISEIDNEVFRDLKSLQILNLEGNGIKVIAENAFKGLDNVTTLDLSRNPDFPLETLQQFKTVQVLYLDGNDYTYFAPENLRNMENLSVLYLNNPFHCNCDMQWASYITQFGIEIRGAICSSPILAVGLPITRIELYTDCDIIKTFQCFNKSISCPNNQVCFFNTEYGYSCGCLQGFNLTDCGICEDLNECSEGNGGCEQICNNSPGGYECRCRNGYRTSPINRKQCMETTVKPTQIPVISYSHHPYFVWALVATILALLLFLCMCPIVYMLVFVTLKNKRIEKENSELVTPNEKYHQLTELPNPKTEEKVSGKEGSTAVNSKPKRYHHLPLPYDKSFETKV